MNHLTEPAILELRDGVAVDAVARAHLDECAMCLAELEEAQARAAAIASALTDLDERFDVESARGAVRARLANGEAAAGLTSGQTNGQTSGQTSEQTRGHTDGETREPKVRAPFWTLGRAATFLLLTTGALSALPGSPLREFISGRGPQASLPNELVPAVSAEPVGMRMSVQEGPVVVELADVPPGTSIEVLWLGGSSVAVRGAAGSSFSSAEGRVQASIVGGPVTVELPESIDDVSLTVNGRMYLSRSGGIDLFGFPPEPDADRIRFIVP